MKIKYVVIGAILFFLLGITITLLSFEQIPFEPQENLPEGMVPITPEVGKTTTSIGNYIMISSIVVLIGTGIYYLIISIKTKTRK